MRLLTDLIALAVNYWKEAIAVLALVLAFLHGRNLSKAQNRLDKVTEDLKKILSTLPTLTNDLKKVLETLPTHPLYDFPKYVPRIAELVRDAKRYVLICCDQPAYGSFSAQKAFVDYQKAILTQVVNNNIPVRITCLDGRGRRKNTERQFSENKKNWDDFKKARYADLTTYLRNHPNVHVPTVEGLTHQEFVELIVREDTLSLASTFAGAKPKEVEEKPPIYYWYVDDAMLFVVSSDDRLSENGFYTRDRDLITSFLDLTEDCTHYKADPVLRKLIVPELQPPPSQ